MGRMTTVYRLLREGDPLLLHFAAFALSRIEQQQSVQRGESQGKWIPKVKLLCTLLRDDRMEDARTMADMIMLKRQVPNAPPALLPVPVICMSLVPSTLNQMPSWLFLSDAAKPGLTFIYSRMF